MALRKLTPSGFRRISTCGVYYIAHLIVWYLLNVSEMSFVVPSLPLIPCSIASEIMHPFTRLIRWIIEIIRIIEKSPSTKVKSRCLKVHVSLLLKRLLIGICLSV